MSSDDCYGKPCKDDKECSLDDGICTCDDRRTFNNRFECVGMYGASPFDFVYLHI